MLKKLLFGLGTFTVLGLGGFALVNAQNAPAGWNTQNTNGLSADIGDNQGINTIGTDQDRGGSLINVIKNFINRVLGILSLIVLVIVLIGGFQMITAHGDETKYKKGFTILKQAGIGLVIIGLARFIVSIVFRILRGSTSSTTA